MATREKDPRKAIKGEADPLTKRSEKENTGQSSKHLYKKAGTSRRAQTVETVIKYTDKSAGQPHLVAIFNELKNLMLSAVKGSIRFRGGEGGQMALYSEKPPPPGSKKGETLLAGVLVQKGYAGFYYMPVYTLPELKEFLHPVLLKCLKGKSCFYIRKYDIELFKHIKDALDIGYARYEEKGWI